MTSRIIAVGDIHGCYYTLLDLLEKIKYDKNYDKLIFLGDYIDRGKNSFEVVSYLINLQKTVGNNNCICLMGNHEDMIINGDKSLWDLNGGKNTRRSYYKNNYFWKNHFWWFKKLPLYYEDKDFIFCHAGLTNNKLKNNSRDDLLWNRSWITYKTSYNEKTVIFGHTPSDNGYMYQTMDGSICLDAGCVFGRNLCAMIVENSKCSFVYSKNVS